MKGHITIAFDTDTGQILVNAPMETQEQKNLTLKVLAGAIGIVVDYVHSPIIKPITNGKPLIKPEGISPKVVN